jgi:phage I-like protein
VPADLETLIASVAASVEVVSDGAPKQRIQILPMGSGALRDGRGEFHVADKAAAEAVIAATRAHQGRTHLMVDYDHQAVYGAVEGVGGQAPAAGWIDPATLTAEADGIYGVAEWTVAAQAKLQAREYRYISPYFTVLKTTRAVRRIVNVGLVNRPAIEELAAVASEDLKQAANGGDQPETEMDLSKIAAAAGLAATATEGEIITKVVALAGTATALIAANQKLGLAADASAEELVAAAARPDPEKYVPASEVTSLQGEVAQLKKDALETKVAASVADALEKRKITPAMEKWAKDTATENFANWEKYLAGAPVFVAAGEQFAQLKDPPKPEDHGLTAEELKVAASMNLSAEEFAAAKPKGA